MLDCDNICYSWVEHSDYNFDYYCYELCIL